MRVFCHSALFYSRSKYSLSRPWTTAHSRFFHSPIAVTTMLYCSPISRSFGSSTVLTLVSCTPLQYSRNLAVNRFKLQMFGGHRSGSVESRSCGAAAGESQWAGALNYLAGRWTWHLRQTWLYLKHMLRQQDIAIMLPICRILEDECDDIHFRHCNCCH